MSRNDNAAALTMKSFIEGFDSRVSLALADVFVIRISKKNSLALVKSRPLLPQSDKNEE